MQVLSNNEVSLVSGAGQGMRIAGMVTEGLVGVFSWVLAVSPVDDGKIETGTLVIFGLIGTALIADCAARIYEEWTE